MNKYKSKIAIIEPHTEILDQCVPLLENCLLHIGLLHCEVEKVTNIDEFLNGRYRPGDYLFIFIDLQKEDEIDIMEYNGLNYAEKIRKLDLNVPIVFVSSVNDYAMETYQVGAAYFVLKPLNSEDCYRMFRHVLGKQCSKKWVVRLPDGFQSFLGDMVYLRQKNNECVLYLSDRNYHTGSITIEKLDKMISVYQCLYQVDKETIVNLWHVDKIDERALHLSNDHYVVISKKQMEEIRKLQMNLQFRQSIA